MKAPCWALDRWGIEDDPSQSVGQNGKYGGAVRTAAYRPAAADFAFSLGGSFHFLEMHLGQQAGSLSILRTQVWPHCLQESIGNFIPAIIIVFFGLSRGKSRIILEVTHEFCPTRSSSA